MYTSYFTNLLCYISHWGHPPSRFFLLHYAFMSLKLFQLSLPSEEKWIIFTANLYKFHSWMCFYEQIHITYPVSFIAYLYFCFAHKHTWWNSSRVTSPPLDVCRSSGVHGAGPGQVSAGGAAFIRHRVLHLWEHWALELLLEVVAHEDIQHRIEETICCCHRSAYFESRG